MDAAVNRYREVERETITGIAQNLGCNVNDLCIGCVVKAGMKKKIMG